jgi:hypothetical protein
MPVLAYLPNDNFRGKILRRSRGHSLYPGSIIIPGLQSFLKIYYLNSSHLQKMATLPKVVNSNLLNNIKQI